MVKISPPNLGIYLASSFGFSRSLAAHDLTTAGPAFFNGTIFCEG
jgi:hypothetical protein